MSVESKGEAAQARRKRRARGSECDQAMIAGDGSCYIDGC